MVRPENQQMRSHLDFLEFTCQLESGHLWFMCFSCVLFRGTASHAALWLLRIEPCALYCTFFGSVPCS